MALLVLGEERDNLEAKSGLWGLCSPSPILPSILPFRCDSQPKQTTLSLLVHPLTSATPLCFLLLAELRRATSPSEVVACVQAISREPHRHCHHPAGACWSSSICVAAHHLSECPSPLPLPPRPLPCAPLACSHTRWLAGCSLFPFS